MPETLRAVVGNGSYPPPTLNSRPSDWLARRRLDPDKVVIQDSLPEKKPVSRRARVQVQAGTEGQYKPFASFQMLVYPEILATITIGSCAFASLFGSLTVLSSVLSAQYGYSDVHIGLCYL